MKTESTTANIVFGAKRSSRVIDQKSLLEFPCEFPVKAMGRSAANIEDTILSIVSKHVPDIAKHQIKTRASSNGRFVGITINITAQSREQIDAIYTDLTEHPDVLYAL